MNNYCVQSFYLSNIGYKLSSHILIKRYFYGPKGVRIDFFGRIFLCIIKRKKTCMKIENEIYQPKKKH